VRAVIGASVRRLAPPAELEGKFGEEKFAILNAVRHVERG
jgi:hypothetical protein